MDLRDVILGDRPVHYYPLGDRGADLCRDLIPAGAGGVSGTYPSAPALGDRFLAAGIRAPKFSSPSYAAVGTWALPAGVWTVELWTIVNTFNAGWLIAKDNNVQRGWGFRLNNTTNPYVESGGAPLWEPTVPHVAGTLYHLAWTRDGSTYRFIRNGELLASAAIGDVAGATVPTVNIGRREYPGAETPWDGWIGHVAVYGRALSPPALRRHYLAGRGIRTPRAGGLIRAAA